MDGSVNRLISFVLLVSSMLSLCFGLCSPIDAVVFVEWCVSHSCTGPRRMVERCLMMLLYLHSSKELV